MNKLALAISITAQAFEKKTDRAGKPYIMHCVRVMNTVKYLGEDAMCAAMMHDLVEDTNEKSKINYKLLNLINLGFSNDVVTWVDLLTHRDSVDYEHYIKRLSFSKTATKIKLADIKDNSDITRLKGLTKKDFERMEKYHRSFIYLSKI